MGPHHFFVVVIALMVYPTLDLGRSAWRSICDGLWRRKKDHSEQQ
jgi:hypothetical protein